MRTRQSEALFGFYKNASRLSRLMAARADRDLPKGMTMSRFELLDLLAAADTPMAPLKIAEELHLTPAAVTHLAGQLKARGLLEIRPDSRDRRAKRISLSEKGRVVHRACMVALSELTTKLLERFSDADFEGSNVLLVEFADWLENSDKVSR